MFVMRQNYVRISFPSFYGYNTKFETRFTDISEKFGSGHWSHMYEPATQKFRALQFLLL